MQGAISLYKFTFFAWLRVTISNSSTNLDTHPRKKRNVFFWISSHRVFYLSQQMEGGLGTMFMKVVLFALVQGLVYLILTKSSRVFSKSKSFKRAYSFRPARSVSIRRILAALQDMPAGGEMSPSSNGASSSVASPSLQDDVVPTTAASS